MKQYLVQPKVDKSDLLAQARVEMTDEFRAAAKYILQTRVKEALEAIREPVKTVVEELDGRVILDGRGYGKEGDSMESVAFMLVILPDDAAVTKLEAIEGVNAVYSYEPDVKPLQQARPQ